MARVCAKDSFGLPEAVRAICFGSRRGQVLCRVLHRQYPRSELTPGYAHLCAIRGIVRIHDLREPLEIEPVHVAAYLETPQRRLSAALVMQHPATALENRRMNVARAPICLLLSP